MKRWATTLSAAGAVFLVLLAVPFATNLETATNNTKSYLPLVAWIPLRIQQIVSSRWVTAFGVGVLAFIIGQRSARKKIRNVANPHPLPSPIHLGTSMLNLAHEFSYGISSSTASQVELRAKVQVMRVKASQLEVPFPDADFAREGFFGFRDYLLEIGHYLEQNQTELAKRRGSIIVNNVGRVIS